MNKTKTTTTARGKRSALAVRSRNRPRKNGTGFDLKFKSILVPTDFSPASKNALNFAEGLARQFNGQITLLHVIEPVPMADFGAYPVALTHDQLLKETRKTLGDFSHHELAENLLKETRVLVGRPFQEIADAARSLKVDLIVIGTHGHSGFARAILGSTAERVVRYAPCPVLTVRDKEARSRKG